MGLFDKMKEPVFLKESSNALEQLESLRLLEPLLNKEGQTLIKQEIKCLEYGIAGEKNIAFELKNSHIPMYILRDIYLEDGDLSAQIDYLVFTRKICFVIECKNLYGDIEINSAGDFIRTMVFGGKIKKEGIYSPITQNQRHLELMKKIKVDNRNNILTKFMVGKYFEDNNKSVVVLANPKTVLNAKYAKKEVKDKVIRADQLVKYIKDRYESSKEATLSDEKMLVWAQSYMKLHKEQEKNYTEKYERYRINANTCEEDLKQENLAIDTESNTILEVAATVEELEGVKETDIFKELKAYRLNKSREENCKPFIIYSDNQLRDLITKMPRNREDMRKVSGFGEVKVSKYGDDILEIVSKY
jgi:hypothetical protein